MSLEEVGFRLFTWRWRIGLVALGLVALVLGREPLARLRARLPAPLHANPHILVLTDAPPPPVGTPFVLLRPELRVLGVVEALEPRAPRPLAADQVVRVSLFPETAELVRDDARIALRLSTPDLLEIFATHFTAERRAAAARRLAEWYRAHERDLEAALARVRELAAEHLGADELGRRLLADPALRAAIGTSLQAELLDQIDWDRVVEDYLDSPAGDATGRFLAEAGLLRTLWAGMRGGYAARVRRALGYVEPGPLEPGVPPPGGAEPGEEDQRGVGAWLREQVLALVAPDPLAFEQAALAEAGRNLKAAFPRHKAELGAGFSQFAVELTEELRLEQRLLAAGARLAGDRQLQAEIVARHGPEAWERVQRLAGALGSDAELQQRLRRAADSALELLIALLREVALDETGTGPNPLVVAFLRARLLGRTQPLLVLEQPGSGSPVSAGQRFEARRR
ncbi:MAG: hypothetical protein KatS3mg102_0388 [Planctomycetota bacterium]|nr:MAG: hypothetical protein KatS3mg102_0388 [Planctomycetota bacterium]